MISGLLERSEPVIRSSCIKAAARWLDSSQWVRSSHESDSSISLSRWRRWFVPAVSGRFSGPLNSFKRGKVAGHGLWEARSGTQAGGSMSVQAAFPASLAAAICSARRGLWAPLRFAITGEQTCCCRRHRSSSHASPDHTDLLHSNILTSAIVVRDRLRVAGDSFKL